MSIRKGDDVIAGASVGFIGKPDWSKAIQLSPAMIIKGYICPSDGIICVAMASASASGVKYLTINGIIVGTSNDNGTWASFSNTQVQVNKGDIVKANTNSDARGHFVPFEYSGVSDINIITPDYIRNAHTLDWDNKVLIPFNQTQSDTWTVPSDGMIIGYLQAATYDLIPVGGNSYVQAGVNDVIIWQAAHYRDRFTDDNSPLNMPVSKGDVFFLNRPEDHYTIQRHIYFIPYKQQIG